MNNHMEMNVSFRQPHLTNPPAIHHKQSNFLVSEHRRPHFLRSQLTHWEDSCSLWPLNLPMICPSAVWCQALHETTEVSANEQDLWEKWSRSLKFVFHLHPKSKLYIYTSCILIYEYIQMNIFSIWFLFANCCQNQLQYVCKAITVNVAVSC